MLEGRSFLVNRTAKAKVLRWECTVLRNKKTTVARAEGESYKDEVRDIPGSSTAKNPCYQCKRPGLAATKSLHVTAKEPMCHNVDPAQPNK